MADEGVAAQIREYLTIDTSGQDNDTLQVKTPGSFGFSGTALLGKAPHGRMLISWEEGSGPRTLVEFGEVVLPDGTSFNQDDLQYAFQTEHIKAYGMCVIDIEYHGLAEEINGRRSVPEENPIPGWPPQDGGG